MAEDNNSTKILEIDVDYSKAIKKVAEYTDSLERLRAEEKVLKEAMEEEGADREKLGKQIATNKINQQQYTEAIRTLNKEVRNQIKAEQQNEGSLKALRAELSNLTKQYDELSEAERKSAEGDALRDNINIITNKLREAEFATQRYYRNVGNYPKEVITLMKQTAMNTGSMSQAFSAGATAVKGMGKQFLTLATNPVFATIEAFRLVMTGIVKVFSNSEERSNRFKLALSAFQPVVNGIKNAFGALTDILVGFIDTIASATNKLAEWIGINDNANASVQKGIELEQARQELVKATRDNMVAEAQANADVSKLRNEIAQKDKYTLKERLAMLDTAIRIEEGTAKRRAELAREQLRILEEEARLTENDAEMNNKLAEAKKAVIEADASAYETTRRLQAQRSALIEEDKRDNEARIKAQYDASKKRAEEAKRRREEEERAQRDASQKELEALRMAEDAMLALVTDQFQKQYEQRRVQGEREIEALRNRLATEKNLTAEARKAINQTILLKERALGEELNRIQAEQEQKLADAEQQKSQERLAQIQQDLNDELEAYKRYVEEQQRIADEEVRVQQEKMQAIGDIFGSLSNLMGQFSEKNKAMAKLSKILALAEIAVNTGKAVSAGIAQSQSVPFPLNIGAIATTVTSILAGMASAISSVKSAKFAQGGVAEYSNGGRVVGAGTGTSDSISARLSNGESVTTALATQMFAPILSAMNQMGGGVPIQTADTSNQMQGEMMLARSFARALTAMPNPVVSVVDVTEAQSRVQTIENLGSL